MLRASRPLNLFIRLPRSMCVVLESIHFNHNPSKATGAFSIRRNETTPVVLPEWRKNESVRPADAPAAYAYKVVKDLILTQKKCVTIKAQFSRSDSTTTKVWVRAEDGHVRPNNVLGTVAETEVIFVQGRVEVDLCLNDVRIPDRGVDVSDVIWKWQYSLDRQKWEAITTTRHRIYTVVDMPREPWQPLSTNTNNTQLPWTEVLEFACSISDSETDVIPAATKITLWANSLGPRYVQYDDPGGGWQGFTFEAPPKFDCSEFLLLINGGKNMQGPLVNCDDCAAIVTSFSTILGCRLREGKMSARKNFLLNPNIKIGLAEDKNGRFGRHNVGWLGDLSADGRLFDACVKLDFDGKPTQTPHEFTVPTNIAFSEYGPRLTADTTLAPRRLLRIRNIGLGSRRLPVDGLDLLPVLQHLRFRMSDGIENLNLVDFRFIETELAEYLFQSFWRQPDQSDIAFGIDMYEVRAGKSTAPLVENILDRFHLRPQKLDDAAFSEAYASEGRFTIVFVRKEFVFLVRNTGRQAISTERLAKFIGSVISQHNNFRRRT